MVAAAFLTARSANLLWSGFYIVCGIEFCIGEAKPPGPKKSTVNSKTAGHPRSALVYFLVLMRLKMQIKSIIRSTIILLATGISLAACGSPAPPPPALPDGSNVQSFVHERELMQRELRVTGSASRIIPARIYNVRYRLSCLSGTDNRSARVRFNEARSLINEKMPRFVEGSTRSNPFYRMAWPARTNRLIVEKTGCEATKVEWIQLSEGREEAFRWVVKNDLLRDLIAYSRGLN